MFFGFNENFSGKLTLVRFAKVGELRAIGLESEKITVLAGYGVNKAKG
jgi:hypothetical protein